MSVARWLFIVAFSTALLLPLFVLAGEHTTDSFDTVKNNLLGMKALLIDVREKSEWDDGHLEDALHAPLSALKSPTGIKRFVERLPQNKVIYTHCAAGARSVSAANILVPTASKFGR